MKVLLSWDHWTPQLAAVWICLSVAFGVQTHFLILFLREYLRERHRNRPG